MDTNTCFAPDREIGKPNRGNENKSAKLSFWWRMSSLREHGEWRDEITLILSPKQDYFIFGGFEPTARRILSHRQMKQVECTVKLIRRTNLSKLLTRIASRIVRVRIVPRRLGCQGWGRGRGWETVLRLVVLPLDSSAVGFLQRSKAMCKYRVSEFWRHSKKKRWWDFDFSVDFVSHSGTVMRARIKFHQILLNMFHVG